MKILSPSTSRAGAAPPSPPPAVPQPKKKRRHRPVATVCRRRRYRLPEHSPTGVSPIGRGARTRWEAVTWANHLQRQHERLLIECIGLFLLCISLWRNHRRKGRDWRQGRPPPSEVATILLAAVATVPVQHRRSRHRDEAVVGVKNAIRSRPPHSQAQQLRQICFCC